MVEPDVHPFVKSPLWALVHINEIAQGSPSTGTWIQSDSIWAWLPTIRHGLARFHATVTEKLKFHFSILTTYIFMSYIVLLDASIVESTKIYSSWMFFNRLSHLFYLHIFYFFFLFYSLSIYHFFSFIFFFNPPQEVISTLTVILTIIAIIDIK